MEVKRGDIIWLYENTPIVEFGDSVQTAKRPFIVISNNVNNNHCSTINVASVSKAVNKAAYPMHVFLDKNKYRLEHNSIVCTEQVKTIPKKYVERVADSLDKEDLNKLNKAVLIQLIDAHVNLEQLIKAIIA